MFGYAELKVQGVKHRFKAQESFKNPLNPGLATPS